MFVQARYCCKCAHLLNPLGFENRVCSACHFDNNSKLSLEEEKELWKESKSNYMRKDIQSARLREMILPDHYALIRTFSDGSSSSYTLVEYNKELNKNDCQ